MAWSVVGGGDGNPTVRISGTRAALRIAGDAYWPGPKRRKNWLFGWPHEGTIAGKLILIGNRAHYDDGIICKVDLVLVGDMLIARDNEMCGGMNVRFDGVYRRLLT